MRITRLVAENIKRIKAIDISPKATQSIVKVGGKNKAGKSSALDSIAMALGGADLCPKEPIRKGEAEGKVVVDLGEFIVTRKFKRDHLGCDCEQGDRNQDLAAHSSDCFIHQGKFGPVTSSLLVTNKDGARYPSPQSVLDKLYGDLAFDPLTFATMNPKDQAEQLRRLVGLDFSDLDMEKMANYNERTIVNREVKTLEGQLAGLPLQVNIPAEEVSLSAIAKELEQANVSRNEAAKAHGVAKTATTLRETNQTTVTELKKRLAQAEGQLAEALKSEQWALTASEKAQKAEVDLAPIRQRLSEAEGINAKVRINKQRTKLREQLDIKRTAVEHLTKNLDDLAGKRERLLAAATFPVPGLGIAEDGVTLDGVPFEQASASEQLRVSVAIGLALNPKLKVLLIRNGNLLDEDSMAVLTEQVQKADAQVWMEYVTKSSEGVTLLIEDGQQVL